jgi:hypothetical protein
MKTDDLDRALREGEIAPTSGFVSSVMYAVRREAATPAPVEFPWARALPGFAALFIALATCIVQFIREANLAHSSTALTASLVDLLASARPFGGGWIALVLLMTVASWVRVVTVTNRQTADRLTHS